MNRDIINIKGTRNGLVICLDSNHDFEELKKTLSSKIESARGFFKGAKFVFNVGFNPLSAEKTRELEDICCEHGLIPDREITWPPQNFSGLAPQRSIEKPNDSAQVNALPKSQEMPREKAMADNVRPLMREASPSLPAVGVTAADQKPCLLVSRSLRSGQRVNYNGNVVVLGDINPGSEVTATGDIVIMGSMRGVVHAGANGDQSAIIMAYRLDPVQLRIAATISRPPENSQASTGPEIARLTKGQMFIEPYLTYGLKK